MKRFHWLGLAGSICLLVVANTSPSQPKAAVQKAPATVEVHYVDGSVVHMKLLDEAIEIKTDFGKLTVPPAQIQAITFGQRVEPEIEAKVQVLIQQLGDSDYQKRELALKALIQLGHNAYPSLIRQQKNADQEIAKRIEKAIQSIEQQVPGKLLHRKQDDVIHTTKFTIVGKITTPTLRAHSQFFGEVMLKPAQLVAIGGPKKNASSDVIVVDAAKYGSAHDQWLPTGIHVRLGQSLTITASGIIDLVPPQAGKYMCGPYGWQNAGKANLNQEGTLQGRIGLAGPVFMIGENYKGQADREGELYLHIVPCIWGNASTGTFQVKVPQGQ
jgi:hypothetical protein